MLAADPPAEAPEPATLVDTPAVLADDGATSRNVVRGGLWTVVSKLLPQLQLFALSLIAARYLGPEGLGRQSFIAFVALSLVQLATGGLPPSLNRFVAELLGARHPGMALGLFGWTRRVLAVAALLAAGSLVTVAVLGGTPRASWVLAGLGSAFAVMQSAPAALLLGSQRWRHAVLPGLATGVLSVPLALVVLAAGGGVTGMFAIEALLLGINFFWVRELARRLTGTWEPAERPSPDVRRRFLSIAAMTTVIAAIELVVWRRSELLVLDHWSTNSEIALYSIAFALTYGLAKIPGAVAAVTMPVAATLVGAGHLERVRSGFWRATRLLLVVTPALAAFALAAAPAFIRLAYGEDYAGTQGPVLILLLPLPIVPLFVTSGALLFALGRVRFLVLVGLAATVVDVSLALLLIPRYGALGAAVTNAIAQVVAGLPSLLLVRRLLRPADVGWRNVAASFAAASVAGLLAALVITRIDGAIGLLLGTGLGAFVWVTLFFRLRPVRADDAAWLSTAVGPRLGRALERSSV